MQRLSKLTGGTGDPCRVGCVLSSALEFCFAFLVRPMFFMNFLMTVSVPLEEGHKQRLQGTGWKQ